MDPALLITLILAKLGLKTWYLAHTGCCGACKKDVDQHEQAL